MVKQFEVIVTGIAHRKSPSIKSSGMQHSVRHIELQWRYQVYGVVVCLLVKYGVRSVNAEGRRNLAVLLFNVTLVVATTAIAKFRYDDTFAVVEYASLRYTFDCFNEALVGCIDAFVLCFAQCALAGFFFGTCNNIRTGVARKRITFGCYHFNVRADDGGCQNFVGFCGSFGGIGYKHGGGQHCDHKETQEAFHGKLRLRKE